MTPDPAGNLVASPANPQRWNQYAYVRNNPATLVDPFGLNPGKTRQPERVHLPVESRRMSQMHAFRLTRLADPFGLFQLTPSLAESTITKIVLAAAAASKTTYDEVVYTGALVHCAEEAGNGLLPPVQ